MWLGIGEAMKIVFLVLGAVVYLIPMVRDAIVAVPSTYRISARDLGAPPWEAIRHAVLDLRHVDLHHGRRVHAFLSCIQTAHRRAPLPSRFIDLIGATARSSILSHHKSSFQQPVRFVNGIVYGW